MASNENGKMMKAGSLNAEDIVPDVYVCHECRYHGEVMPCLVKCVNGKLDDATCPGNSDVKHRPITPEWHGATVQDCVEVFKLIPLDMVRPLKGDDEDDDEEDE